jgi:hypothetical protein
MYWIVCFVDAYVFTQIFVRKVMFFAKMYVLTNISSYTMSYVGLYLGGEWGEVGDLLEEGGLPHLGPLNQHAPDRKWYSSDIVRTSPSTLGQRQAIIWFSFHKNRSEIY